MLSPGGSDFRISGRQQGAFTIFFVAILGLLTLLAVRSMTTTTTDSVRITSNTHTSTEAFLAAEEAMALGMEWLADGSNSYTSALWSSSNVRQVNTELTFSTTNMGGTAANRDYTMYFGFEADPDGGSLIKVVGYAVNDAGHNATVSQWVELQTLLQSSALDAPLRVAGCLQNVRGQPDIFSDTSPGGSNDYVTLSRASTYSNSANACPTNYGNNNTGLNSSSSNSSSLSRSSEAIVTTTHSGGDQWDQIFTQTRAWFEANVDSLDNVYLYEAEGSTSIDDLPSAGSGPDSFTWSSAVNLSVDNDAGDAFQRGVSAGQSFTGSWGTISEPAVVVIRGCPGNDMLDKNGSNGYRFVGLVFIEASSNPENAQLQCSARNWRRLQVLGALIVNGDITEMRQDPEFISADVGGISTNSFPASGVFASAGSWTVEGD